MTAQPINGHPDSQLLSEKVERRARDHVAQAITAAAGVKSGDAVEVATDALETERHIATCETVQRILEMPAVKDLTELAGKQITYFFDRKAQAQEKVASEGLKLALAGLKFFLGWMVVAFVFMSFLVWQLKDQKDLLLPIFSAVIGLVTGASGGFLAGRQLNLRPGK